MEEQVKQNKESRITIRLSKSELETLEAKMSQAGYKSAGAFIRDFVANGQVKPKLSSDVVQIARELMNLASMINAERPGSELLEKVKHIARINVGGVQ
ncbi:ribbon-helix-helix domain-containing protein [Pseudomonas asiatica]|uniref:Ribbon-helix-helix domain-containing protein n=1 Tax=Pseudomonas asiatica TaxID=2219225 RepID=A0AAJ5IP58_9PSED|nr:ribbon-helix-helix domain-containing protein [Pseudomonas asiatica]UUC20565.1 ribbon-helix-helix domain-containing protein [Pseudomonas asiatica]